MSRPTPVRGIGPATPVGVAAQHILSARLGDVLVHEQALRNERTADGVHDMRVACRRLRAGLGVFAFVNGLDEAETEVKRLQDALGEVRDRDVQLAWLEERKSAAVTARRLRSELPSREEDLTRAIQRFVRTGVPLLRARLGALDDGVPLAGKPVRKRLQRRLRQLERRLAKLRKTPDPTTAHEARKTVKKLRYEVELIRPALPGTVDAITHTLRPVQELLGELHDHDVRLELIASTRDVKLRREVTEARGALMDRTTQEIERWQAEDRIGTLRTLIDRVTGG